MFKKEILHSLKHKINKFSVVSLTIGVTKKM